MKIFFFIMFAFNSFAGDSVNNGGGLAEQNLSQAYINLEKYIDLCLNSVDCKISTEDKNLLLKIKTSLSQEYQNQEQIQYSSESKNPGFFVIDGQVKIAKTGDDIGDAIYFNSDLLYQKNNLGEQLALTLSEAVAILIHELGHHHGVKDHTLLDLVGVKVSSYLDRKIDYVAVFPHSDVIQMAIINQKKVADFSQVLLYVQDQIIDISETFKKELQCANLPESITGLNVFNKEKPVGVKLHNAYWLKNRKRDDGQILMTLKGNLAVYCNKNATLDDYSKRFKVEISFRSKLVPKTGNNSELAFEFVKDSVKVNQIYRPWWQIISISVPRL